MSELTALDKTAWADATWPLGTHVDSDGGVTFAVHAPAATRLQLEIYPEALGATASAAFLPARGTDGVWRARLGGLEAGALVGFRAWGQNWLYDEAWAPGSAAGFIADLDEQGNRFNPNKVLFDPYSREITHNVDTDALAGLGVDVGVFGTGGDLVDGVPRRQIDTAPYAPKGVVVDEEAAAADKPQLPPERAIIYETGVRQFTGHPSTARLTDLLAGEPGFEDVPDIPAEYQGTYRGAGLLAPYLRAAGVTTIEFLPVHETNASESARPGATNAWGYMTLDFFAPNRQYAADRSPGGPTREFKEMVSAFHAAGMEVYLDVVYNHTAEGENIEVIAEAWDLWGYEVGNFPRGWGEWNGRYRDAVRRFTKGDANTADFLNMVNGDYHHFEDNGGPQKSINFVVAHDGFNLADLVSYQTKVNDQPYPFGPSDGGSDDNLSWDSGGDQGLRRQRLRNLWTILMFSRGVPMVVAGDEFGRTQNGNNNPWALDSTAMRNNYAMIATNAPQRVAVEDGTGAVYHDNLGVFDSPGERVNPLFRFSTFLMRLRGRHACLHRAAWGDLAAGGDDVSYLFLTPAADGAPREGDRALAVHIDAPDDGFRLMINMADTPVDFRVPAAREGRVWRRLVDTAVSAERESNCWAEGEGAAVADGAAVQPWSVLVWHEAAQPDAG